MTECPLAAKAIEMIIDTTTQLSDERLEQQRLHKKITLKDIKRFGGEDGMLDKNEFAICKLKAMKKVNQKDIDSCYRFFTKMNVNNDGFIDIADLVALAEQAEGMKELIDKCRQAPKHPLIPYVC